MTNEEMEKNESLFVGLVGKDFFDFIVNNVPKKVGSRIGKSIDHYKKALVLERIDPEMGVIRLIAAEEELVVAIFELLKLNADKLPAHDDFIRKFKNHQVKLAFAPVLAQFRFVLGDYVKDGATMEGLEILHFKFKPVIKDNKFMLEMSAYNGDKVWNHNPLDVAISQDNKSRDETLEELYREFERLVQTQMKMTVRQFVTARAEYRNKLLYADDAGFVELGDEFSAILGNVNKALADLLWTLALLIGNAPSSKTLGLADQFVSLYRRILVEAKIV